MSLTATIESVTLVPRTLLELPPATQGHALLFDLGVVATPHLISATTQGSLGSTFDVARWTPVVIVMDVPPGSQAQAVVTMQEGAGLRRDIAYQAATPYAASGFSPLYAQLSTVSHSGDRVTLSLLPSGGWWSSPTIAVGAFQEAT